MSRLNRRQLLRLLGATPVLGLASPAARALEATPDLAQASSGIPPQARAFLYLETFDEQGLLVDSRMQEVGLDFDIRSVTAPARLCIVWNDNGVYRERQLAWQ